MPRRRHWRGDGIEVTSADDRRWMQSVGARITPSQHSNYVINYQVVEKIAHGGWRIQK
jgi:hypothetical protein